jgi:hypothetical protein
MVVAEEPPCPSFALELCAEKRVLESHRGRRRVGDLAGVYRLEFEDFNKNPRENPVFFRVFTEEADWEAKCSARRQRGETAGVQMLPIRLRKKGATAVDEQGAAQSAAGVIGEQGASDSRRVRSR